jgi:hypothetical protein
MTQCYTGKGVAAALGISPRTVKYHRSLMSRKLEQPGCVGALAQLPLRQLGGSHSRAMGTGPEGSPSLGVHS